MEILFPTSLDIIAKEKSNNPGIKPILISRNSLLESILNILISPKNKGIYITYAILVRDDEAKKKFKQEFAKNTYLVFTLFEAKVFFQLLFKTIKI